MIGNLKERLRRAIAWKRLYSTEDGRRVVDDIIEFCLSSEDKIVASDEKIDPYRLAINKGRRDVALHIARMLKTDVKVLLMKINETEIREAARKTESSQYSGWDDQPNT